MDKHWEEFQVEHAHAIVGANVRKQEGWAEPDFVSQWYASWQGKLRAYTLMVDGQPVACIGLALQEWNKAEAWALMSKDFSKYTLTIYRLIRKGLKMVMDEGKIQRIQATIDADYPENVRWIESLGFQHEGRMRKYGPQGQDYLLFSMVA